MDSATNEAANADSFLRVNEDSILVQSFDGAEQLQLMEQRPARILIEELNDMDDSLLETVSARSTSLKRFVKLPLLYVLANAGLQSGLSISFLKIFGELIQSGHSTEHIFLLVILFALLVGSGACQTHSLNIAMKYYN